MKYVVKELQACSTTECLWLRFDNVTVMSPSDSVNPQHGAQIVYLTLGQIVNHDSIVSSVSSADWLPLPCSGDLLAQQDL